MRVAGDFIIDMTLMGELLNVPAANGPILMRQPATAELIQIKARFDEICFIKGITQGFASMRLIEHCNDRSLISAGGLGRGAGVDC